MPLPKRAHYTMRNAVALGEIIEGTLTMEEAPPSRAHQQISGEIYRQIANYLEGKKCKVYSAPFAVRPFEKAGDSPEDVDTMVEPDVTIVCDIDKLDDAGCKGAPDMVLEVLSPSTQRHDRLTKFNLYQEAGVKEYWIVDPESKTVQVYVLDGGHYRVVEVYTAVDLAKVNALDGCFVELSKVFKV